MRRTVSVRPPLRPPLPRPLPGPGRPLPRSRIRPLLRAGAGLLVGGGVLVATVAPASAHANFGQLSAVPTNTDQDLVMEVPLEKGDEVHNVDVVIAVPTGWTVSSCPVKPDWTCAVEAGSGSYPKTVHYKSQGTGSAREDFQFRVHTTDQLGTFKFPTIQKYSDGTQSDWVGGQGDPNPAPLLKTTQGPPITVAPTTNPDTPTTVPPTTRAGTPTTRTAVTNPGGAPTTTVKAGVTTTAAPGAPATTTTTASTGGDPSGSTPTPQEPTTTTPGSTLVAVPGTGTVPGTAPAVEGFGAIDASARPPASPSGGNGPLLGAIGVAVLAGLAGVLVFRKSLVGGGAAAGAAGGPEITPEPGPAEPPGPVAGS